MSNEYTVKKKDIRGFTVKWVQFCLIVAQSKLTVKKENKKSLYSLFNAKNITSNIRKMESML